MAGNLPPGVIQLTQGSGGPRPPVNRNPPPPPPPPGVPRQANNPQPPPNMPQQPMMQGPPMQHFPTQPPPHTIPLAFRPRRVVQVSDIRRETMTEAQAREQLSTYIVFRFEKNVEDELDIEGKPVMPNWENVVRTELQTMTQSEAIRQVRKLDKETKPVQLKVEALSPAQRRQLDLARDELSRMEHDRRYQYVMAQINEKLEKLDKRSVQYLVMKPKKHKSDSSRRRRSSSSSHKKHKPKYTRVWLTAYFKRTPRPQESAILMLQEKEQIQRHHREQEEANVMRLMQPQPPAMPAGHGDHGPRPPPMPPQQRKMGNAGKQGNIVAIHDNGKKMKAYHGKGHHSAKSSSDSYFTDSSCSGDEGTNYTPTSTVSSGGSDSRKHERRRRSRSRSRPRIHDRPEQYGIEAPRRHSKHEQHYIMDSYQGRMPRVPAPPSPVAVASPIELGLVQEDAYHRGRADERAARLLEARAVEEQPYRVPARLPPRIIQHPVGVRVVSSHEVARQRHEDDLDRVEMLQMDDRARFEIRRRQEERRAAEMREHDYRQRRAMEDRLHHRDVVYDDLDDDALYFEDDVPERIVAPEYVWRRQPSPVEFNNPFDPLGRRVNRRHSVYEGSAGYRV